MEKTARRMARLFIAVLIVVIVVALVTIMILWFLGRGATQSRSSERALTIQAAEADLPGASKDASPKPLPPKVSTDLRVEAWFSSQGEFGDNLQPMLEEIGKRLEEEPEGARHLPEGVSEGSYDCLFRWSIYEDSFAGTPAESFASQLPGWTCSARIVFREGAGKDDCQIARALKLWQAIVSLSSPETGEIEWSDEYLNALFSWRKDGDLPPPISGDVRDGEYAIKI
jgi:hypothetical protein